MPKQVQQDTKPVDPPPQPRSNTKPTKPATRVPELLQWKEPEMADEMSTLMMSERSERTEKGEGEDKKSGEERVAELLQWKEREMAEGMEGLMRTGGDSGGNGKDGDVEMGR